MQTSGQTSCVVTGGARGIGRAIADLMVKRGHAVVVTDINGDEAQRTAQEIGAAASLALDVSDPGTHREAAAAALELGPLTAWFNNAGIGTDGTLAELSDEQVRRLVDVNLLGVLWGMRTAFETFGPQGGDVVNTASLSSYGPVPGLSVYAATKAAVLSITMSAQVETPRSVRVHAICPDGVDTPLLHDMDDAGMGKQLVFSGVMLSPEDVAAAAVDMLGSGRVVRTLPGWRGGLARVSALSPGLTQHLLGTFAGIGKKVMQRSQ